VSGREKSRSVEPITLGGEVNIDPMDILRPEVEVPGQLTGG
jgi:hypothetical protein